MASAIALASALGCNLITGASDLKIGAAGASTDGGPSDGANDGGAGIQECVAPGGYAGLCLRNRDGWSPIVLPAAGTSCPPDYTKTADLKSAQSGVDKCECTCAPQTGSCDVPLALEYGDNACSTSTASITFPPDGGCYANIPNLGTRLRLSVPDASAPSGCTPKVDKQLSPVTTIKTCSGATPTAASECDGTSACFPAPPPGAQTCIAHDGEVQCPRGYDRAYVAGSSAIDGRDCTSCTCTDEGCSSGRIQLYADAKCTLPLTSLSLGKCDSDPTGLTKGASYKPATGCRATRPPGNPVTGRVTFTGTRTICCL